MSMPRLALFDLDNTLLTGDTDVLWCEFLIDHGLVDARTFASENLEMERRYRAGLASAEEFCGFYVSTLRGRSPRQWMSSRDEFFRQWILPRIPDAARSLVAAHRACDDMLVLTTATNRFLTELTARELGIENLLATEMEQKGDVFTGKTTGVLNMREGKVTRLVEFLQVRGLSNALLHDATFYSDSINDLPLLEAVMFPVAVDPDDKLVVEAKARGWNILKLDR